MDILITFFSLCCQSLHLTSSNTNFNFSDHCGNCSEGECCEGSSSSHFSFSPGIVGPSRRKPPSEEVGH